MTISEKGQQGREKNKTVPKMTTKQKRSRQYQKISTRFQKEPGDNIRK